MTGMDMTGMDMTVEERVMWEAIDRAVPRLRKLTAEMRTRGEDFTADEVLAITDDLAASRPKHVAGEIQRKEARGCSKG